MKEKHIRELEEMREKTRNEFKIKQKLSKDLIEKWKKVRLLMGMKKYDDAETLQKHCDEQEKYEKDNQEDELALILARNDEKTRQVQQKALAALLKWI